MPSNFPFIVDDGLGRGRSFFKLCSSAQENLEERQEVFLSFFDERNAESDVAVWIICQCVPKGHIYDNQASVNSR